MLFRSAAGVDARGTLNNCGTGYTPWGTYLTGEENWAGYFFRANDVAARGGATSKTNVSLSRYGKAPGSSRHGWQSGGTDDKYARWDVSQTGASTDGMLNTPLSCAKRPIDVRLRIATVLSYGSISTM